MSTEEEDKDRIRQFENWNGGELEYCRGLIRSRGTRGVSRRDIPGYLRSQAMAAGEGSDPLLYLAQSLRYAATEVSNGNWEAALKFLTIS